MNIKVTVNYSLIVDSFPRNPHKENKVYVCLPFLLKSKQGTLWALFVSALQALVEPPEKGTQKPFLRLNQ
jgi:hypothetical protein